jgi:RNA polymerase sigma factor (sigma-70 family)
VFSVQHNPAKPIGPSTDAAPADPDGFADWVRPHLTRMANLAARLAPMADRDDIVQESLVRAWQKRAQHDPARGTPAAWLLAIVADRARRARRRARPSLSLVDGPGASPGTDEQVDVERALRGLTKRQRLAVDCYYFADLSVAETATVMNCSEGTVKSTLADARAKLRPLLEVSE